MEEKDIRQEMNNVKKKKLKLIVTILLMLIVIIIFILNRKKPTYSVSFDSNGGSLIDTIIIEENGIITEPEDPTRENYEFVGWYYNDELYDFSKPVTCDIRLEARWAKLGNITGIKLDKTELTLNIGDTYKLTATVTPLNYGNKLVIWESNNPDIVSVDSNGNIKALKEGTATITVKTNDGKYTAKTEISVVGTTIETSANNTESQNSSSNNGEKPSNNDKQENTSINVTGISLNTKTLNLTEGDSAQLTATVNPSNATNKNVTWESSNTDIVSVDSNGNIKALREGTATITVTTKDGGYTAKATITVNKAIVNVTGVSLNTTSLSLTEGESSKLTATVNPSNATNKNVTWESSNPNIVSVDANGNIKALQAGSATITVITNDGNYKATCQVTVEEKVASYSVIVTPYVEVAGTYQYSIAVTKDNKAFNDFEFIIYNGKKVGNTLSSMQYNKKIESATIRLKDGDVTATVIYK